MRTSYAAQEPRVQVTAMAAMLAAALALVAVLTHTGLPAADAGRMAGTAYAGVVAVAVLVWRLPLLAVLLSTLRIAAALVAAAARAPRTWRARRHW
ncbi:hypothetical protein ACIGZJ_36135 [Kitasatospora sp. NPDC052868]|uniref:hypothetical protein n=1 Tax=Kitasatospora sp. NPDC052868 TaxID=3364060 RepID=UPI0037C6E485